MYGARWGQLLGNRTGVAVGLSAQAWDEDVTVGPLVLSANDTVVTVQAPGAAPGDGTYGVLGQSEGIVYWEIVFFSDSGSSDPNPLNVGLIDSTGTMGEIDEHIIVAALDGQLYGNGDVIGTGWIGVGGGDTIGLWVDLDTREFRVRRNGDEWSTAVDISYMGAVVFPYVDIRLDAGGAIVGRFSPSQWLYAPPEGASAWVGGGIEPPPEGDLQGWDPATAVTTTVSGAGLVATADTGTTVGGVRGLVGRTSGKVYWEIEVTFDTGVGGPDFRYGVAVCDSVWFPGSSGDKAFLIFNDNNIYESNSSTGATTGGYWETGRIQGIACDFDTQRMWVTNDSTVEWLGATGDATPDPVTGSGGIDLVGTGGDDAVPPYYPFCDFRVADIVLTGNFLGPYACPSAGDVLAAGFGSWGGTGGPPEPTVQAWDPATKSALVDLTGSDLIVTGASGISGTENARGIVGRTDGKIYWETEITTSTGVYGTGVCDSTFVLGTDSPSSLFAFSDTNVYKNGADILFSGMAGIYASGTVVCHAVDIPNMRYWCRISGNPWVKNGTTPESEGDPTDPSTGIDMDDTSATAVVMEPPIFPMVDIRASGVVITGRFTAAEFTDTPPAGYGEWV